MNYLAHYQTFATKFELNEAIALHIDYHQQALNDTDLEVLTFLSRYAIKYPGVAHLKVSTMASKMIKNERTIRRTLKKLEDFHILRRKPLLRSKTGGQGANLYIFLPFDALQKTKAIEEQTLTLNTPTELEPVTHYTRFARLVSSYIGEHSEPIINQLYNIFSHQASKLMKFSIHEDRGPLFESLALEAVSILFQTTKRKKVYSLTSYYDGIYRELINRELFSNAFFDYDEPIDFLLPDEMGAQTSKDVSVLDMSTQSETSLEEIYSNA